MTKKAETVEAEIVEPSEHQKRFDLVETAEKPVNQMATYTPMDMIQQAIASGAGLETMERLFALQVKHEENEAKKAFFKAFAAFKTECPIVPRTAKGQSGLFSDLADISKAVDPVLSKHGLAYRWSQNQDEDKKQLTVVCHVSHRDGHTESSPLTGPLDASGNKNAIQSIGSSNTYLLRYTLIAALGLATKEQFDDDGDGAVAPVEYVTDDQWRELDTLITQIKDEKFDVDYFCKCYRIDGLDLLPASKFTAAKKGLNDKIKGEQK